MIKGFCNAYSALGEENYLSLAIQTAEFIETNLFDKENKELTNKVEKASVKDKSIEKDFDYEKILEDTNLVIDAEYKFKGEIKWK